MIAESKVATELKCTGLSYVRWRQLPSAEQILKHLNAIARRGS